MDSALTAVGPRGSPLENKIQPAATPLKRHSSVLYHTKRSNYSSCLSSLSFVSAIVLLWIYFAGTITAGLSLGGSSGGVDGTVNVYAEYKSYSMKAVLADLIHSKEKLRASLLSSSNTVLFFQTPSDFASTWTSSYELSNIPCSFDDPNLEAIYSNDALIAILSRIWNGFNQTWQSHWRILIDCTFGGISDASAFRATIVDSNLSYVVTVTAEVMNIIHASGQMFTSATVAYVVNTTLTTIQTVSKDEYIRPLSTIEVIDLVGITYPFEDGPFRPFKFEQVNRNSSITATILKANGKYEQVLLMGYDGAYRDASQITGHYYSYSIKRPSDAVHDINSMKFLGVPLTKNAWAWGHVIFGLYAVVMIQFYVISGCLVAYYTSKRLGYAWFYTLPDLSHHIALVIAQHGVLSIVGCLLDRGWCLYEWAYISIKLRNQYSFVNTRMVWHVRAMAFSWIILLAILTAQYLHVNVALTPILIVLILANNMLDVLNTKPWGLFDEASEKFYSKNQGECLVPSRPGYMDLWTYHELSEWNIEFIANEMSCFIWALICVLAGIVLVKIVDLLHRKFSSRNQIQQKNPSEFVRVDSEFVFENRQAFNKSHGLHTAFSKRQIHRDIPHASPEWLWGLGYVIIANIHLFHLQDVPKLLMNYLLQDELFYVYGYTVNGNVLGRELNHVLNEDFSGRTLFQMSLLPLRQEQPQGETNQHHQLYQQHMKQ